MKKFFLKFISAILILVCFSFCSSYKNHSSNSITGLWSGNYSWNCGVKGNEKIKFNLSDNQGLLSGTATLSGVNHQILGYRLEGAVLGEWRYENGKTSPKGNNIVIEFINSKNNRRTTNIFSGELKNNVITGITMNGKKCSSYKGASGKFTISFTK
ncbi:MAG: hypothetical protein ACI8WA_000408 [Polaribacter sp.]|jgi:hypothetical protein